MTTLRRLSILAFALLAPIASAQPVGPTIVGPQPAQVEPMPEMIYEEEPFGIADPPIEPEFVGEPDWCKSPYRNSAWRFGIDIIPTELGISHTAFGDWDSDGGTAVRLEIGRENPSGVGVRAQLWSYGEEDIDTDMGNVDFSATTFYLDFYKRLYIEDAELALGGGLAGAHTFFDIPSVDYESDFSGGGVSVFGDGFYPLWRWKKTDLGSVAQGRITLLNGEREDDDPPVFSESDHDQMTIIQLAWGLEFRRRFGRQEDKYWYIRFMHDMQRWESSALSDSLDPGFDGFNTSLGVAW